MSETLIRVLIVDDEPIARRGIRQLLAKHSEFVVAGEARNGKEAARLISALKPDLIFLDVQMPEMDGMQVIQQIKQGQLPAIIFVTAHDSYAVEAFNAYAVDYLLKPVTEYRFMKAIARFRERLDGRRAATELSQRASTHRDELKPARRLVIGGVASDVILDMDEILWIRADDYYAEVNARDHRHLLRESLKSLESRLDRSQFVRVHRRAIVNLAHVREICSQPEGESSLVLVDGTRLPLSRRRRQIVEAAIRRFAH